MLSVSSQLRPMIFQHEHQVIRCLRYASSDHSKLSTWRRMAPSLMLYLLTIELVIAAQILFLRCSVNGSISFNYSLIYCMKILFVFHTMVSSVTVSVVVIGGKLCQETNGHGRKPDEPHSFGASEELMETVNVSSTTGHQRMPAESNGLTTPEELMEMVHVSSTGIRQRKRSTLHKRSCVRLSSQRQPQQSHISHPELSMCIFGLPRRPDLDVSQCCNGNVRWSPPDPMVNSYCYHFDGKHVCVPKVFWTPANPNTMHFYLDSGAGFHMTGNQFILQAYPDHLNIVLPTQSVSGIDGSPLPVSGCGFINSTSIRLDGILYVEGLVANLVSVAQLAIQYSVRIVFETNLFTIEKIQTGEKIGQGHREGNHYVLDHFLPKYLLVENPACFV